MLSGSRPCARDGGYADDWTVPWVKRLVRKGSTSYEMKVADSRPSAADQNCAEVVSCGA